MAEVSLDGLVVSRDGGRGAEGWVDVRGGEGDAVTALDYRSPREERGAEGGLDI